MYTLLMVIFIVDIIILIPLILMQSGSGAQSGMFGSDLTLGAFGAKTSEVLVKFTRWMVIIFFVSAFFLGYIKIKERQEYARRHGNQPPVQQTSSEANSQSSVGTGVNLNIDTNLMKTNP